MRALTALLATCTILAACATSPDPKVMMRVGNMERNCSRVSNSNNLVAIPVDFKISPVEAARSLPQGCYSKFFYSIYADEERYYFVNNDRHILDLRTRDAEYIAKIAFVVDGKSGLLLKSPSTVEK
jgi:hypothetical protein